MPATTTPTRDDLIVEYIGRMPATALNVASHYAMSRWETSKVLNELEQAGRIRRRGRKWEIANG